MGINHNETTDPPTPSGHGISTKVKALVGLLGFANGAAEPSLGARAPMIRKQLNAPDWQLSVAWAGWPLGMLLASFLGGRAVERFGARVVTVAGGFLYFTPFSFLGRAHSFWLFLGLMFLTGCGNALFDAGWGRLSGHIDRQAKLAEGESSGLVIQILTGLFSLGSVVSATVGWALVKLDVPLTWHIAGVGLFGLIALLVSMRSLPNPGAGDHDVDVRARADVRVASDGPRPKAPRIVRAICVVGALAALPVGVGYMWSSVYLDRLGASEDIAALGVIAFTAAETIVRLGIGTLSQRFRRMQDVVFLAKAGAVLALVGVAFMVVPQSIPTTIVGLALLAAGIAPIGGIVQDAAQNAWDGHRGLAAGLVVTSNYTAIAAGPVFIGPMSSLLGSAETATPLRIALACIAILPVLIFVRAHVLRPAPVAAE